MLCNICNDDVFEEDEIKCSICNGFHHFACVALRESAFRKMSKNAKRSWCCIKCKNAVNDSNSKSPITHSNTKEDQVLTNESFRNLINSVNFMSDKFDQFGSQIQELVKSINVMREENRILKEQNINLSNDLNFLQKRMNNLEQKALDNFVEIIGVPEITNENCKKTVEKIATSLKLEIGVVNAFRVRSKLNTRPSKIVAELTMKQNKRDMIDQSRKTKLTEMEPLHYVDIPSEKATFAMGCFWAPDSLFGSTPGIITTRVGYAGGTKGFVPTYRNIGDYTEAIQLQFDPTTVSYLELLKLFWDHHDPTAKFKKQYSSFIFYHNDQQKTEAEKTLNEKKSKGLDILTKIEPVSEFFNAEDYHQKYRLQQHKNLCKNLGLNTGDDLINSHVAARLNGYVVGQGGVDQFDAEASKLKLDEAAIKYIRQLAIKYEGQGLHC